MAAGARAGGKLGFERRDLLGPALLKSFIVRARGWLVGDIFLKGFVLRVESPHWV